MILWRNAPCASFAKKRKYAAKNQPEWVTQMDDHFTKLANQLIPDSEIAGKFTSDRLKITMIVKKALPPRLVAV